MTGRLSLVTGPEAEPLTTAEAKTFLRIDTSDEDTLVASLVKAARVWAENTTNHQMITATWDYTLDCFPGADEPIELPRTPLASVSSITYTDEAGDSQVWGPSNYTVDTSHKPGRVFPAYNVTWPTPRYHRNVVVVRFVAGYGAAATDVPENFRMAMRQLVSHWYEHREAAMPGGLSEVPISVSALLAQERLIEL